MSTFDSNFAGSKMKISYNWLKTIIPLTQTAEEISESLTMCGLEVESIEQTNTVKGDLTSLVVGQILNILPHPNADKLQLTQVQINENTVLPIVCGAKNIATGQKVVVAPVGATLYPIGHEPFKIKSAKIRREVSEGMICAEDEIGVGKSHDGVIVLPNDIEIGTKLSTLYQNESDQILEIAILPNRGDAISHLGLARELTALTGIRYQAPSAQSLDYRGNSELKIENNTPENCLRYTAVCLKNIKVAPSPQWLQSRLKAIGLNPINNVVDITNFIQHDLGQPLHAFDYAKIYQKKIVIRMAEEGEKMTTLDGIKRILTPDQLIIADGKNPVALAGIMGGLDSGVTESTHCIMIESAYFNPVTVRKNSKKLGIQTDSSYRFERGSDIEITELALKKAVDMMIDMCEAELDSPIFDLYPKPFESKKISLDIPKFLHFIGEEIPTDTIVSILQSLEFKVSFVTENNITIEVPSYRTEIERPVDLYEEIIRIYGFDQIKITKNISYTPSVTSKQDPENLEKKVGNYLAAIGFNEVMNNSLVPGKWYNENELEMSIQLMNPLSTDLNTLRMDLCHGIMENIAYNLNRKNFLNKFFEFGTIFYKKGKGSSENRNLVIALSGNLNPEHWNSTNVNAEVYMLRGIVSNIFTLLNISNEWFNKVIFKTANNKDLKLHGLKTKVHFAVIPWEEILTKVNPNISLSEVPKFPIVRRDLSLVVDKNVKYDDIKKLAQLQVKTLLREIVLFDVYEGKPLEEGKVAYSVAFYLYHSEKTLEDIEIDKIMNDLIRNFENQLGVIIRK